MVLAMAAMVLAVAPMGAAQSETAHRELLDEARDHHRAGRAEQALAAYERVARSAETADPATAAIALNNRCLLLTDVAEYAAALEDCRRALELRRGLPDENARVARTLNNLARVLQLLGRYDEARRRYGEALAINRGRGDAYSEVLNRANLGWLAISEGEYAAALDQLERAEEVARRHQGEPWVAEQLRVIGLNRGVVFEKLGAYREALQLYRQVAAERERMEPSHWAALRVNIGVLYRNLGDPVYAIEAFQEAAEIYRRLGNEAALANVWLNVALAQHRNLRDLEAGERAYLRALELARQAGDRNEEMQASFYLGDLLREEGRLAEAQLAFRRGLELARASGSAEGRWSALRGLGQVAFDAGRLERALELLEDAIAEVERVRAKLQPGARRSGYFGDKRPVYATTVAVLATLREQASDPRQADAYGRRALGVVQRAKARDLQEAMGALPGIVPLEAHELERRLGGDVALELFAGPSSLYAWRVSRDGVDMFDLGPVAEIEQQAARVHRSLAAGHEPSRRSLVRLSELLVRRTGLADVRAERLWISPAGRLSYLPFEILENPSTGRALVEEAAVAYLPCASLLALGERSPAHRQWGFLGFGNPRLGDRPSLWQVRRFRLQPLPAAERELASIAGELPGLSGVWTGAEATEGVLRRESSRGARVMHLATHTLVDDSLGDGAVVLLAPGNPGGGVAAEGQGPGPEGDRRAEGDGRAADDDGVLTPAEVAELDLNVGLTVLASCRSAVDSAADGRALGSLTGSLLAAGSSAVVATLWDVEDQATAVFMEQLYHQLKQGLPPSEALRRAKRHMRTDPAWGRTHLWAAYVLVGDAPQVVSGPPLSPRWWAVAVGLLTSLVVILWGRRRRPTP